MRLLRLKKIALYLVHVFYSPEYLAKNSVSNDCFRRELQEIPVFRDSLYQKGIRKFGDHEF